LSGEPKVGHYQDSRYRQSHHRVLSYLQDRASLHRSFLYQHSDPDGLIKRIDQFLKAADRHKISTIFCIFDDCAFSCKEPYLGRQDDPIPGVHNSGWTPSPGHERVVDRLTWPQLENFVTTVVLRFAGDQRILAWDIYNEPGNGGMGDESLPLFREAFRWAYNGKPEQSLTTAIWDKSLQGVTKAMLKLSDIITFHNYGDLLSVQKQVSDLKSYGRPVICTEWMARHHNSLFRAHLPFFKREKIGCYCWGLPPGAAEPDVWFQDLLYPNGKPYREKEIEVIREHIQNSMKE